MYAINLAAEIKCAGSSSPERFILTGTVYPDQLSQTRQYQVPTHCQVVTLPNRAGFQFPSRRPMTTTAPRTAPATYSQSPRQQLHQRAASSTIRVTFVYSNLGFRFRRSKVVYLRILVLAQLYTSGYYFHFSDCVEDGI